MAMKMLTMSLMATTKPSDDDGPDCNFDDDNVGDVDGDAASILPILIRNYKTTTTLPPCLFKLALMRAIRTP